MHKKLWSIGLLLLVPAVLAQTAGDVNGDGQVDRGDVTVLQQYLKGQSLFSDNQTQAADLTGDGRVDNTDLKTLQRQLGLIPPDPQLQARANENDQVVSSSARRPSFEAGIASVVPEWVRGRWTFTSRVTDARGGYEGAIGLRQKEAITLPGDLSGEYALYKVDNRGVPYEQFKRVCWQVLDSDEQSFQFVEQNRDRAGMVLSSTYEITNQSPGQARIRLRSEVLNPGSLTSTPNRNQGGGILGGLFGMIFGGGSAGLNSRPRLGDYSIRTGVMYREPGTERERLSAVDLEKLRCRNGNPSPRNGSQAF
ncbi:dockerin type I repeat-containing protein [Candidatus Cyanaurora vandensis]|uniref:dockerin type I repeat-containing protein n=1 Tax=Candidatus Cyanaurora vandensis TaxID=2714958 RepID=UPI00257CB466|nr:dockerin type I repeat-containing protein [Candidatus Cyanaurora vandensis]